MNHKCASILAIAVITLLSALPASAFFGTFPVGDDAWDVNQGAYITDGSDTIATSSSIDVIGAYDSEVEPGACIFADNQSSGYDHWVRWSTPSSVHIASFNLFAADDGAGHGRSFDYFTLRAIPAGGTEWVTIYETDIAVPYAYEDEFGQLIFSHTFGVPVTAQQFEARFRQHTDVPGAKGPRILELDGFAISVPEPGSLLCIASALISFAGFARRRRQS